MPLKWTGEVGVAGIVGVAQLLGLIVGGTLLYSNLVNQNEITKLNLEHTAQNTKETAKALSDIRMRTEERTTNLSERMIKVESTQVTTADTVARIENKIDGLKAAVASPPR